MMVEKKVKRGKQVKEGGNLLHLLLVGAIRYEAPTPFSTLLTPRAKALLGP